MKKSHFIGVSEEMADVAVAHEKYFYHAAKTSVNA